MFIDLTYTRDNQFKCIDSWNPNNTSSTSCHIHLFCIAFFRFKLELTLLGSAAAAVFFFLLIVTALILSLSTFRSKGKLDTRSTNMNRMKIESNTYYALFDIHWSLRAHCTYYNIYTATVWVNSIQSFCDNYDVTLTTSVRTDSITYRHQNDGTMYGAAKCVCVMTSLPVSLSPLLLLPSSLSCFICPIG